MRRIPDTQHHSRNSYVFSISKTFERIAYYGFRGVFIFYLMSDIIGMERAEALEVYGQFVAAVFISMVLGALAGDFLIGNRRAMIIGGILQMGGFFILLIQNQTFLMVGSVITVIGSGLYSSNLIAQFGEEYLHKNTLSDAGFTFFFLAINIAGPIGVWIISPLRVLAII